MAESGSQVFVVANAPEHARIAGWLRDDGLASVRTGEGGDDTLAALTAEPAEVVVLDAGIRAGDGLAFATALRAAGRPAPQLVLLADESGQVRHALDGVLYRADRFLRRPLSRAALLFAVRSCLKLGRPDIAAGLPAAATAAAFAVLGDIVPAPRAPSDVGGVAGHTLAARIDEATAQAVDAFLTDKLEEALNLPGVDHAEEPEPQTEAEPEYAEYAVASSAPTTRNASHVAVVPAAAPGTDPPWSSGTGPNGALTEIPIEVGDVETPVPASSARAEADGDPVAEFDDAARMPPVWRDPARSLPSFSGDSGSFVAVLREHMSTVEARLFGKAGEAAAAPGDDGSHEIDVDAITANRAAPEARSDVRPEVRPIFEERLRSLRPATTGDLAAEDVASVFGRLFRDGFSGRIAFRNGQAEKLVLLDDGRPVFAGSNLARDRMGDLLVREGKITRDQLARASEIVVHSGRRMGEILVELGYLKRRELLPAVRRHIEDILYSLFSWEEGSYSARPGGTGREEKIRLAAPTPLVVVEGVRRKVGLERLRRLLGPAETVLIPERADDLAVVLALADADLGPDERRTIELFDGERTLGDVIDAAPLGAEHVQKLAWGLVALGMLHKSGPEIPAGVAPAAWSSSLVDAAIDRERILAKHAHVLEADYFLVLGVRPDATAFEIRRAHEAARRDYAPDAFAPELQSELAAELREIAAVLDEAYRVLRGDALRQSYLAHLAHPRE